MASANRTPFYYVDRPNLLFSIPDKYLAVFVPVVVYWLFAIPFDILDHFSPACLEKYRIHESDEKSSKNRVSKSTVIRTVLFQQFIQVILGTIGIEDEKAPPTHESGINSILSFLVQNIFRILAGESANRFAVTSGPYIASWLYWWGIPIVQLIAAMFMLDTWQYVLHRLLHTRLLFKYIHSWHHQLYVPYAYGALYNHPIEGFMLDLVGSLFSHLATGMTSRQATLFFGIATAKTIHDHSGWSLPFDPMNYIFKNNSDYHDIHHQMIGIKSNFSQPFFVHWDAILGTEMTREQIEQRRRAKQE